jgi:hypothetical protein
MTYNEAFVMGAPQLGGHPAQRDTDCFALRQAGRRKKFYAVHGSCQHE